VISPKELCYIFLICENIEPKYNKHQRITTGQNKNGQSRETGSIEEKQNKTTT
jgi:hypothetical protein